MRVPTTLAACSLTLVGCIAVNTTQLGPPHTGYERPRVAPDEVVIYRTADQVPVDYEEVALLHATGSLTWSTESEMFRDMREEAGRLGANAIILEPVPEPTVREKIIIQHLNVDIGREGRGVAIYIPRSREESGADDPEREQELKASYTIGLENGSVIPAEAVEPSGIDQLKVTLPNGTVRYLSSSKVRDVTDRAGRDWKSYVVDERRRLPVVKEKGPF